MRYQIRRATEPLGAPTADVRRTLWETAEVARVTHYQREDSGHRPPTAARALYDDDFLAVCFAVNDQYVRAVARKFNDMVCQDSCVEFFVAPDTDASRDAYFNFEINCGATMLLYRCPSTTQAAQGGERVHLDEADGALLRSAASLPQVIDTEIVGPTDWSVEFHVPWVLFEKHFGVTRPVPGSVWRGNFYKCGDHTSHPHWGSWAPMATPKPGFHQPACFQPLQFT
ncbi:MAG: carbohydrate-binding family 9-like protein [bacterium]|nr:carbohydrate-binding family 9-like protein [bacterium]